MRDDLSPIIDAHIRAHPIVEKPDEHPDLEAMTQGQEEEWRLSLVNYNIPFAIREAAKREQIGHGEFDDLLQEAMLGLSVASRKFDPKMDNTFLSYATWWIRALTMRHASKMSCIATIPMNIWRDPEFWDKEAESKSDYVESAKTARRQLGSHLKSIDEPVFNNRNGRELLIKDTLSSDGPDMKDQLWHMVAARVDEFINDLPERHATAVCMKFGLRGYDETSLSEIGKMMGVTRERARQIVEESLNAVRVNPMHRFDGMWECAKHIAGMSATSVEVKKIKNWNTVVAKIKAKAREEMK